jgi:exodeoxyribonuclease-3
VHAENLKILSYNIYKGMSLDKSENKSGFVTWIDSISPDIVSLQEVNGFTQATLEKTARDYGHPYAVLLKEEGYPVALTSKFPIVNVKKVIDNMHHGFIQAQVLDFNIIVLHLSPHKYWKRNEEVDLILSTIKNANPRGKWIIMGDFNTYSPLDALHYQDGLLQERIKTLEEKYKSHENLKENKIDYSVIQKVMDYGFLDALRLKNASYVSTVPTYSLEHTNLNNQATMRIDYIFISKKIKEDIVSCSIIKDNFTHHNSDHYPVLMELKR